MQRFSSNPSADTAAVVGYANAYARDWLSRRTASRAAADEQMKQNPGTTMVTRAMASAPLMMLGKAAQAPAVGAATMTPMLLFTSIRAVT